MADTRRKSILEEFVATNGTTGLNKSYVDYATAKERYDVDAYQQAVNKYVDDYNSYSSKWTDSADTTYDDLETRKTNLMKYADAYKNRTRSSFEAQTYFGNTYANLKNSNPTGVKNLYASYSNADDYNLDWNTSEEEYDKLIGDTEKELSLWKERKNDAWIVGDESGTTFDGNDRIYELENQLEKYKSAKWRSTNRNKYSTLSNNADYGTLSKTVDKSNGRKLGIIGTGDDTYSYINNLNGQKDGPKVPDKVKAGFQKYDQMTQEEIDNYNYLYQKEGKDSANEYLKYLSYDLDARRAGEYSKGWQEIATEAPVISSALSVPATLLGIAGIANVAGQNIARGISGEYSPINYNSLAMNPVLASASVRGTVSQNIADKTGTINLSTEDHPVLSRILNGKSLGDVYQLGMSMVDSGATALLGGATGIGAFGTVLLGGSAGSQGVLTALEKGATDKQALAMGILNGTFEALFEYISLDKLLKGDTKNILRAFLEQGFVEGTEELNTTLFNTLADICVMAENSDYKHSVQEYMNQGCSEKEASRMAMQDIAINMGWDFIGGAISGGIMGSGMKAINNTIIEPHYYNKNYGDKVGDIATQTLNLNPESTVAKEVQSKIDNGEKVKTQDIKSLVEEYNKVAEQKVSEAYSKAVEEYDRNHREIAPQKVEQEQTATADTRAAVQTEKTAVTGNNTVDSVIRKAYEKELSGNDVRPVLDNAENVTALEKVVGTLDLKGKTSAEQRAIVKNAVAEYAKANPVNVQARAEQASASSTMAVQADKTSQAVQTAQAQTVKAEQKTASPIDTVASKYGKQAKAVKSIYNIAPVENTETFSTAFDTAYTIGLEGGNIQAALENSLTQPLTEVQRRLAYETGKAVRLAQSSVNAGGKKTGSLIARGGLSSKEINSRFKSGSNQETATSVLRTIAEATGITIELFDSADSNYEAENGSFDRGSNVISIDISAGINSIKDVNDLKKYVMLRTFCHEFTHFGEKFAAEEYNILRTAVIEALSGREEFDFDYRVNEVMEKTGLSWDMASCEVVAEAMTDVLPESKFIESVFEKSPTLGEKILNALRDFVATIKDYFANIAKNGSREAQALKVEINGTIKYMEGIVDKWDAMARAAVENYNSGEAAAVTPETATAENITKAGIESVTDSSGNKMFQLRTMKQDVDFYMQDLRDAGLVGEDKVMSEGDLTYLYNSINRVMDYVEKHILEIERSEDFRNMDATNRPFLPYKDNADPHYKMALDYSTLCRKRLLTQAITERLQASLKRALTPVEQVRVRNELKKLQEEGKKIEIACALCYVEAARLKTPKVINEFLNHKSDSIKAYFSLNNKAFKKDVYEKRQGDWKEARGLDRKATKKEITAAGYNVKDFNKFSLDIRKNYWSWLEQTDPQEFARENAIIDIAEKMDNARFLNANELARLRREVPDLYDAFITKVRQAARSKAQEADVPYARGDISSIGDALINKMNEESGFRHQSWSDFQAMHLLDTISAIIELSTRKAKAHTYTKVPAMIRFLGNTGMMMNMSLIPYGNTGLDENGNLLFDPVEGMPYEDMLELRKQFHETAGNIAIGISDEQIKALLNSPFIDYVIPYHISGLNADMRRRMGIKAWKDYTKYQNEKGDGDAPSLREWFNEKDALSAADGIGYMVEASKRYLKLCAERGLTPKFAQFLTKNSDGSYSLSDDAQNYWKLLIDRKMVDQTTNSVIMQKAVVPKFDVDTMLDILKEEVNSQAAKDAREAEDYIVNKMLNDNSAFTKAELEQARIIRDAAIRLAIEDSANEGKQYQIRDLAPATKTEIVIGKHRINSLNGRKIVKEKRVWNLTEEDGTIIDSIIQDANDYPSTDFEALNEFKKRPEYTTVWQFKIPEEMKQSVLYEGQVQYSLRNLNTEHPEATDGLNFRDPTGKHLEKVFNGTKIYETRDYHPDKRGEGKIPNAYLNKLTGIVQTGDGKAKLVGYWQLGDGELRDYKWLNDHKEELGNDGTAYEAEYGDMKWVYPISNVEQIDKPREVPTLGNRARKINTQYSMREQPESGKAIRKMLAGTLFSGGGTVDFALSAIIDSQFAYEYDAKISAVYQKNNETTFMGEDVKDFDPKKWKGLVEYLHASPVCKTFSRAISKAGRLNRLNGGDDMVFAQKTAEAIREIQPKVFTLEQVPEYYGTEYLKIITDTLEELGYDVDPYIYNAADYGAATSRERLFVRAVKDGKLPPRPQTVAKRTAWYDVISDLIDTLPEAKTVNPRMVESLKTYNNIDVNSIDKPLLVFGESYKNKQFGHAFADSPMPTIIANSGASRIFMPDGRVLEATPRVLARITGLPDNYQLPADKVGARTIIGNGIPPKLTQAVAGSLLNDATGQNVQFQSRISTLSDRDVLRMAADETENRYSLTEAERSALQIFKERLGRLDDAENKRQELLQRRRDILESKGDADATEAEKDELRKIQNNLNTVNGQISRFNDELLKVEEQKVLHKILKKSREVIETEDNQQYRDKLKAYREKRDNSEATAKYRKRITETAYTLSKWLETNSDKEHIPEVLKKPIGEILESIDMSSKRALSGGKLTKADERFGKNLAEIQKILSNQQAAIDGDGNAESNVGAYLDLSPESREFLDDLVRHLASINYTFTVNEMTTEQLKLFDELLRNIAKAVRMANKLLANARYQNIPQMAKESMEHMDAMGKATTAEGTPLAKFLQWTNTTPYYAFKRFGKVGDSIFDGFTRGWEKLATNAKEIIDFTAKTYTPEEVRKWKSDKKTITLENGKKIEMTTAQIMELSQLLNREQARKHIEAGGIRIGDIDGKQSKLNGRDHYHLTAKDLETILGKLSRRQMKVAEELRKYMGKRGGEWGNEISMARFGYEFYKEGENYYTIKTDDASRPMKDTDTQNNSMFRLLNLSSSKSLNPKATNALIVNDIFDTFADHMSDMAKLNALGLPILDAIKWYNYSDRVDNNDGSYDVYGTKKSMGNAFGNAAEMYFRTLLKDINGVKDSGDRGGTISSRLMSNYKIAAVAANLRVFLLQPTSYVRAMYVLSPKNMISALAFKKNAYNEAMKYSGTAVWKSLGYYDTDIARSMREQIEHDDSWMDKVKEKSMALAELGDQRTWGRLWVACKLEAKERNAKLTGEELSKATADIFREVIYATQVMDSTLTRSEMMRGSSTWTKLATAFMAEPTLSANILMNAASQYSIDRHKYGAQKAWQKNSGKIGLALTTYVCSAAASALVESLIDAMRDDDDYETFLEKFNQAFFGEEGIFSGNLGQDLTIIGKIPVLKDIINTIRGSKSSDMSIASIESVTNAYNIWKETIQLANGILEKPTKVTYNGNMTNWGKIYKTLQAISQTSGFAVANTARDVIAIWNSTIGYFNPDKKLKTYDAGDKSNIKYAYQDGYLTQEEAMAELVSKGVAKNEDEAYWLVNGFDGEDSKYSKLKDALESTDKTAIDSAVKELTSHGVKEDTVTSKIKEEIGNMYKGTDKKAPSINEKEAVDMLVKYGGMERDKAQEKVTSWKCEIETGYKPSGIMQAYSDGEITAGQAEQWLVKYKGKTTEEAHAEVVGEYYSTRYPGWSNKGNAVYNYNTYGKAVGLAEEFFVDTMYQIEQFPGTDKNGDGEVDRNSKRAQAWEYIDSLPLTVEQKDALHLSNWAESTLRKAPWHK